MIVDEANVISGGWDQRVIFWVKITNFRKPNLRTIFQKLEEGEYRFSEAVKLDSYVNILCTGTNQVYYAGGKSGYLAKISKS